MSRVLVCDLRVEKKKGSRTSPRATIGCNVPLFSCCGTCFHRRRGGGFADNIRFSRMVRVPGTGFTGAVEASLLSRQHQICAHGESAGKLPMDERDKHQICAHGESAGKLAMDERDERAVALFADWVRSDGRLVYTGRSCAASRD
eukprot:1083582-Prymnesium_polylepis.1